MDRQQAHQLLDELGPAQFDAVAKLLEVMIHAEDGDELTEEDRRAVDASREYFRHTREAAFPLSRWPPSVASPWIRYGTTQASKSPGEENPLLHERSGRSPRHRAKGRPQYSGGDSPLRVGNHRVFFEETEDTVTIHHIRDRRQAYR